MAKSSRKSDAAARNRSVAAAGASSSDGPDILMTIVRALVVMLVVARWLVPTESTPDGGTLWLTQITFGVGAIWVWACFRARSFQVRWRAVDWLFAAVVFGHVVSAVVVVATQGDKRAAINMAWEWLSLGTLFFLLRQVITGCDSLRKLAGLIAVTGIVLAGFGIWQYYIFYPAAVHDYDSKRAELNQLQNSAPGSPDDAARRAQRIRDIELEFYSQGVPSSDSGRQLFERRLRNSREPFGMFALANSFAGLLVVGFFATLALFARLVHKKAALGLIIGLGSAAALIAYCILLTKSRTAFTGLVAGIVVWGVMALITRTTGSNRRVLLWGLGAVAAVGVLLGAAVLTGGVDAAVFSEASKSLSYRKQYWQGALKTIGESPLFGTGPGNFRQHYLKHKLPESSEEIADPHNFMLDLWVSGGVIAFAGFVNFLICIALAIAREARADSGGSSDTSSTPPKRNPDPSRAASISDAVFVGAMLAFGLVFFFGLMSGMLPDGRVALLGFAWMILWIALRPAMNSFEAAANGSSAGCGFGIEWLAAALVGFLLHLCGAGGIEMPALTQIILILATLAAAMRTTPHEAVAPTSGTESRLRFIIAAALIPIAFAGCLLTATMPVLRRTALVAVADAAVSTGGASDASQKQYTEAAAADPFAAEPLEKLAELQFARWEQNPEANPDAFDRGADLATEAIALNPFSPHGHQRLGEWQLRKFARSENPNDARMAVESFAQAAERMPNQAGLRAALAEAYEKAGDRENARQQATKALELDGINRAAGHAELYLPKAAERAKAPPGSAEGGPTVEQLRKLAGD